MKKYDPVDKFTQPAEHIHIVRRAPEARVVMEGFGAVASPERMLECAADDEPTSSDVAVLHASIRSPGAT